MAGGLKGETQGQEHQEGEETDHQVFFMINKYGTHKRVQNRGEGYGLPLKFWR